MIFCLLMQKTVIMESTNTSETLLWLLTAMIAAGMVSVLVIGWLKGMHWQKELKLRRRQPDRYDPSDR